MLEMILGENPCWSGVQAQEKEENKSNLDFGLCMG